MPDERTPRANWHALLGLALQHTLGPLGCQIETEFDLSKHKQLLDILVIRRDQPIPAEQLPDGLRDLPRYTLITYKSMHEPMDDWALEELTGHYVNVRKQHRQADGAMLDRSQFLLVGVSTRHPRKLMDEIVLEAISPGVYLARRGTTEIRVVVLNEVGDRWENAVWDVFSANPVQYQRGRVRFKQRDPRLSTLLAKLVAEYGKEGVAMPLTLEDLERELIEEKLAAMTPEQRMRGLSAEERLRGLPVEERLRGLPVEERLRGLTLEEIEAVLRVWKPAKQPDSTKEPGRESP